MHLDRISEAIAHFIGLFQIATEQARMRDDYLEFKALQAISDPTPADEHVPLSFQSPYDFDDPDPGVHYVPAGPTIETMTVPGGVAFTPVEIPVVPAASPALYVPSESYPDFISRHFTFAHSSGSIQLTPPGSVATHVVQINTLSDNDFVNVGAGNLTFQAIGTPNLDLEALYQDALQFLPIPPASFGSAEDIGSFVSDAATSLKAFVAGVEAAGQGTPDGGAEMSVLTDDGGVSVQTHVSAFDAPMADAIYVNGRIAAEAPKLDDVLPAASPLVKEPVQALSSSDPSGGSNLVENGGSAASGVVMHGTGNVAGETSVSLNTGSNALVNSAAIINDMLEGGVFAVAGNHYSLNAIVQINAWGDSDSIGSSLSGWSGQQQPDTTAYNIAQMLNIDTSETAGSGNSGQPSFPKAWAVTEINGDLISLNWTQQVNFLVDNDTVVVSSTSGVTTTVGTGANQQTNALSIADLGKYYDLVLIGGSYYDANIITQTNVLLDNDVVGALANFQTQGQGSVSNGDNLLWNNAKITSIGSSATAALPSGFAKTLDDFAHGNHTLSSDVLNDEAFQGLGGLKVLYISGSVYDLQYISQTNVLGDSDDVALALNAAHANTDANWSIVTGSNALINSAQIIDVDPAAKTYVGGEHYSDELLVQTDIIRTDHLLETQDADHLVNEAVAFLSDDMAGPAHENPASQLQAPLDVHPAHNDVMQSVIS